MKHILLSLFAFHTSTYTAFQSPPSIETTREYTNKLRILFTKPLVGIDALPDYENFEDSPWFKKPQKLISLVRLCVNSITKNKNTLQSSVGLQCRIQLLPAELKHCIIANQILTNIINLWLNPTLPSYGYCLPPDILDPQYKAIRKALLNGAHPKHDLLLLADIKISQYNQQRERCDSIAREACAQAVWTYLNPCLQYFPQPQTVDQEWKEFFQSGALSQEILVPNKQ